MVTLPVPITNGILLYVSFTPIQRCRLKEPSLEIKYKQKKPHHHDHSDNKHRKDKERKDREKKDKERRDKERRDREKYKYDKHSGNYKLSLQMY